MRGSGVWGASLEVRLDKHRDDGASDQAEGDVTQHAKERCSLAGVGGDGDDGACIGGEDGVEDEPTTVVLCGACLGRDAIPEFVMLGKGGVNLVVWERVVDIGAVGAAIAGVSADAFAEELLDRGHEGVVGR